MADAPRRRGPKPQGPFENKRFRLSLRITEDTRRMLEQAAADSGRSLMQEAELRLVESFTVAAILAAAARATAQGEAERSTAERMVEEAKRQREAAISTAERTKSAMERAELILAHAEKLLSHVSAMVQRPETEAKK